MSWADAWPSREDQRATTLAMKLGGRRLVARRHSGVDAGVCGDEYRQIRPGVAGSCIALACDRRRGGGRGVSPPWRRSAGASVMAIVWQSPAAIFLMNYPSTYLKPRYQRLVTSAPRSDPSTLLMTRLVYWLEPSRRAQRTTPGQLRVHTPYVCVCVCVCV